MPAPPEPLKLDGPPSPDTVRAFALAPWIQADKGERTLIPFAILAEGDRLQEFAPPEIDAGYLD